MSTESTVASIVVGAVVGVVAAYTSTKVVRDVVESIHKEELAVAEVDAYWRGWAAANSNEDNVRKRYAELTEPTEKGEGLTMKTPKKV
jgi:hypothetical protein